MVPLSKETVYKLFAAQTLIFAETEGIVHLYKITEVPPVTAVWPETPLYIEPYLAISDRYLSIAADMEVIPGTGASMSSRNPASVMALAVV